MRRNPTSAPIRRMAATAAIAIAALLAAPSCSKEGSDEPSGDGGIDVRMTVTGYDNTVHSAFPWGEGDCILAFDRNDPSHFLGIAFVANDGRWLFDNQGFEDGDPGLCRLVYSEVLDVHSISLSGISSLLLPATGPSYCGEGKLSLRDGRYKLSGALRPATARVVLTAAEGSYELNNAAASLKLADATVQPTLCWPQRAAFSSAGDRTFYNNVIPRVRIGDTVYRYRGPGAESTLSSGTAITIPFPTAEPSLWESAPYTGASASLSRTNIFPGASSRTLINRSMESPMGFLFYLEYEWTAYAGSIGSGKPGADYPFVLRIYSDSSNYSDNPLNNLQSDGVGWTQSFSWTPTGIARIDVVADDYDIYLSVPRFEVANF